MSGLLHDPDARGFASDNNAGVHPEVLRAVVEANGGHVAAYGADGYTERFREVMRGHFGQDVEAFPVFNGTGANVVGLQSMLPRWGAVICARTAHINVDENGAPERVIATKLLAVDAPGGKLTPGLIDLEAWGWGFEHRAQPAVVSIAQSTELGTVYSAQEVRAIADHVHSLGMRLHMDGSRIANAAAALELPLRAFTSDAGVDVLSLGGTKNGLLGAEAVVVMHPDDDGIPFLRKIDLQLASKMRFVSAQLVALYESGLWLRSASYANTMASRLRAVVENLPGVQVTQPTEANSVFAIIPAGAAARLRERFAFYDWAAERGEVRWMCSFDTMPEDVDAFGAALADALQHSEFSG
jgi:threonine aldolase